MAFHSEAHGSDLHEPSRIRIVNSTGSELAVGTWVFIGADVNASGFIPITRVAAASERDVAFCDEVISTGATATVQTLGRLRGQDTSTFSVGDFVQLASSTTYASAAAGDATIGRVIVSSASNGVLNIDTITVDINDVGTSSGLPTLGTAGQELQVNSGATALEYFTTVKNPSTIGTAGQILQVNTGATALEFTNPSATGINLFSGVDSSQTVGASATDVIAEWNNGPSVGTDITRITATNTVQLNAVGTYEIIASAVAFSNVADEDIFLTFTIESALTSAGTFSNILGSSRAIMKFQPGSGDTIQIPFSKNCAITTTNTTTTIRFVFDNSLANIVNIADFFFTIKRLN